MKFIINPGTEPVKNTSIENAIINIESLIEDSGQSGISFMRDQEQDDEGRYYFILKSNKHDYEIEVEMPGCPLEVVKASKPFYSPRLYVDGSSWLWKYALTFINFDKEQ